MNEMTVLSERWAQRRAGGKMHIVSEFGQDRVAVVSRCGVSARGQWRLTSNVPWGRACGRCRRCHPRFEASPRVR